MATRKPNNTELQEGEEAFTDEDKHAGPPAVQGRDLVGHRVNPNVIPDSFDEAIALLKEQGEGVVEYEGSPWHVVDKKHLVGNPLIIMGWGFTEGDRGVFVSLLAIAKNPVPDQNGAFTNRVVINDGGTGIRAQWETLCASGKAKPGTLVNGGLRVSQYDHPEFGASETYYLA